MFFLTPPPEERASEYYCSDIREQKARVGEYAPVQATYALEVPARRSASVPPLYSKWTSARSSFLESSFSLARKSDRVERMLGNGDGNKAGGATDMESSSDKLRGHFLAALRKKQCPQTGIMSERARQEMLARKEERLENARLLREVFVQFILSVYFLLMNPLLRSSLELHCFPL